MNEISTTQVYYAYFNESKDTIKAYKVIDAVFNIETMRYTLTLNIANEGVKTIVVAEWGFFLSPLDVVNDKKLFSLKNLSLYASYMYNFGNLVDTTIPYAKNFRTSLMKNGFVFNSEYKIVYYLFSGGVLGEKAQRMMSTDHIVHKMPCLLIGTYNLLTNELKGVQFNPKAFCPNTHCYKTKQECLDAQMPKVVEFGEQSQNDAEISFNFNVSIKAKDAKEAQRKFSLMVQMVTENVEQF